MASLYPVILYENVMSLAQSTQFLLRNVELRKTQDYNVMLMSIDRHAFLVLELRDAGAKALAMRLHCARPPKYLL